MRNRREDLRRVRWVHSKRSVQALNHASSARRWHLIQDTQWELVPSRELIYPLDKAYLKMIFLFPRWDMLISWRAYGILHEIPWKSTKWIQSHFYWLVIWTLLRRSLRQNKSKDSERWNKPPLCRKTSVKSNISETNLHFYLVVSTHLKNINQNGFIFPK